MKKIEFCTGRTLVCAVLNITPDSFSDGGKYLEPAMAVKRALECEAQGADLIDIGAESSRPGSTRVSLEEELRRLLPVITAVASKLRVPVSVDTYKPAAALACIGAGASYINDITGFTNPDMLKIVAGKAGAIVMHMRGTPENMQAEPKYEDVVKEVSEFLSERALALKACGAQDIILDPGIGFGKTLKHNLALLNRLEALCSLGYPLMLGVSRKAFIGALSGVEEPSARLPGTIAACVCGALKGAAIVRVHDVAEIRQALAVSDAINDCRNRL